MTRSGQGIMIDQNWVATSRNARLTERAPTRRRFVTGLVACLLVGGPLDHSLKQLGDELTDSSDDVPGELKRLERADPEVDFSDAIRRREFRFLGVAGFTLAIPGVPMSEENILLLETHGVRVIPGTSDNPVSLPLQMHAVRYAERYNKLLLEYLLKTR